MHAFVKKILLFIALSGFVFAAVIVLFSGVYLNSAAFRGIVVQRINNEITGKVAIDQHHLALLAGRVELTGIRLDSPGGGRVADVRRLTLAISWPALLRHEIDITSLVVENPCLSVLQEEDHYFSIEPVLAALGGTAGKDNAIPPPPGGYIWKN